jgi:hypothetical protein
VKVEPRVTFGEEPANEQRTHITFSGGWGRKCGARTNELRDGRIVLVTNGRCGPCADLER